MRDFDELTAPDMNRSWFLISWTAPFVALLCLVFLVFSSVSHGRELKSSRSTRGQMICTVSSFFSFDANDRVKDTVLVEGRGLANCRNDQGYTLEFPVATTFEAVVTGSMVNAGELSFSANTAPFVVSRELSQLQDRFEIRSYSQTASTAGATVILLRGTHHDLAMQMKLTTTTGAFENIQLRSLSVRFDENAPTLD